MRYGAFSIAGAKLRPFFELANFFVLFFQKSFILSFQIAHISLKTNNLTMQEIFAAKTRVFPPLFYIYNVSVKIFGAGLPVAAAL